MRIEAAGGQKVTVFEEHVHSFPSHGIESCNEKKRISRQDARDTNKNVIAGMNADSNSTNNRTAQTHVRKQRTMSGTIVANKHGP